jgi:hypothetical protein
MVHICERRGEERRKEERKGKERVETVSVKKNRTREMQTYFSSHSILTLAVLVNLEFILAT